MIAPTPASARVARNSAASSLKHCPTVFLPAGGIIVLNPTSTITLHGNPTYRPNCAAADGYVDPFYASTTVFVYVIALTTLISWTLLILLLISQRSAYPQRPPRPGGWLQGRGVPAAMVGRTPLGGLGNRPWLQKVAVFLVTLGLTVASVDTFKVSEVQHQHGITSARWMRDAVVQSYEIRVLRIVSDIFVWLAQVQTLIRLFPRRKEKLIIKWFGFSLILCDLIFSSLDSFYVHSNSLPGSFQDAISALSYLFQLSISLLYAAWVLYYVATKRRFAFFRPDQLNMSIVAALAMTSIAIPVAFFIADISVPAVAGWGDFFRWSGAAAASVVVWEWVERIEALEREEKKDGILGREIFDEDELPITEPSSRGGTRRATRDSGSSEKEKQPTKVFGDVAQRYVAASSIRKRFGLSRSTPKTARNSSKQQSTEGKSIDTFLGNEVKLSTSPSRDISPRSRDDFGNADGRAPDPIPGHITFLSTQTAPDASAMASSTKEGSSLDTARPRSTRYPSKGARAQKRATQVPRPPPRARIASKPSAGWALASNIFKRRKRSPPLEIKKVVQQNIEETDPAGSQPPRFDFKGRFFAFRDSIGDHLPRHGAGGDRDTLVQQQPTVIPAPPRGHTWSPDILRHSPVTHLQHTAHVNPALIPRQYTASPLQASVPYRLQQDPVDSTGGPRRTLPSASRQQAEAARHSPAEAAASSSSSSAAAAAAAAAPAESDNRPNANATNGTTGWQRETRTDEVEETSGSSQTTQSNGPNGPSTDSEATAVASSSNTDESVRPDPG